MRKNKLLYLMLTLVFALPSFAKKKVALDGSWGQKKRSPKFQLPIEAWVETNNKSLLLEFSANLGMVEVTVKNQVGEVVFSQFVETRTLSSAIISLNKEVETGYVLSVTDGENFIYGIVE